MMQKSSPQFQATRANSVSQRLKDEEQQEREGLPDIIAKNSRPPYRGPGSSGGDRHISSLFPTATTTASQPERPQQRDPELPQPTDSDSSNSERDSERSVEIEFDSTSEYDSDLPRPRARRSRRTHIEIYDEQTRESRIIPLRDDPPRPSHSSSNSYTRNNRVRDWAMIEVGPVTRSASENSGRSTSSGNTYSFRTAGGRDINISRSNGSSFSVSTNRTSQGDNHFRERITVCIGLGGSQASSTSIESDVYRSHSPLANWRKPQARRTQVEESTDDAGEDESDESAEVYEVEEN